MIYPKILELQNKIYNKQKQKDNKMGLLTEIALPMGGNMVERESNNLRDRVITESAKMFDEQYSQYSQLGHMLESDDPNEQYMAGLTLEMVDRTRQFIDRMKEMYGESTVTSNLGALPQRVLDVVRIFYPNQIANELVDIQPIDGEVGQIFTMTPRFSDNLTNSGVSAGDEVFKTIPTENNYASEEYTGSLGTGDGVTTAYALTPPNEIVPIRPSTVKILTVIGGNASLITDDGNGNLVGGDVGAASTINYTTGAVDLTYSVAPDNGKDIKIIWCYDSEVNLVVRDLEFDLAVTPVRAKIHPVKFKYSVAAGLAAQAHLAIDVQDTLAELAAQYIKIERDNKLVALINASANTNASLNFDASPPVGYDRRSFYGEIELKLDAAESLIQTTQGRGGVDWVLCGTNAANIFRNARGFRPVAALSPIGAHVIGTMRDGTVTVVKSLLLNADTFIFGYKGYMAGDAATILAEWIPVYFTPTFQDPTFKNEQGVMSMYDLFVNNSGYYFKGTVSNYNA